MAYISVYRIHQENHELKKDQAHFKTHNNVMFHN